MHTFMMILCIWIVGLSLTNLILMLMYRFCGKFGEAVDKKLNKQNPLYFFEVSCVLFWPMILPILLYSIFRFPFIGEMFKDGELD